MQKSLMVERADAFSASLIVSEGAFNPPREALAKQIGP